MNEMYNNVNVGSHNPYFNRWFSAMIVTMIGSDTIKGVTILILIDGFLQYSVLNIMKVIETGHNPYFNRWFSAISEWEYMGNKIK